MSPSKTKNKNKKDVITNESIETSTIAYNQGYSDGRTGYGLPASQRVSAYDYYMARGLKYSSADKGVYVMGYNDGINGRAKRH